MELQAVMEKRRSIRHYNPERKVTKEQLEELIKAASYAPSWKNLQTSRYYCVLSENAVKELREKCLPEFNQANSDGAGAYIVTTFVKGMVGFDKNTGSPVNEAGDGWGYYDLGLQNENLLLKAAEQGLDTLVMGIRDGEALRELLNIPDSENVVSVIAVGYRGQEPPEREKSLMLSQNLYNDYKSRTGARKLIDKMMKAAQYKQAGFGVVNDEHI